MLERNSILLGIILGLCVPFVGYAVILMIFDQIGASEWLNSEMRTISFRARTIGVLAICLNLIPFNIYRKWRFNATMRGIIIATFMYVAAWIIRFSGDLFNA